MASAYGEDASVSALRSAYDAASVVSRLSRAHRRRLDREVASHLCDTRVYREAPLVLGYVPQREEFDCRPILARALRDGKDVALPAFDPATRVLSFRVVVRLDDLVSGRASTREPNPATSREIPRELGLAGSVCLVPGLAFDAAGYRVAYGAGYWDGYLRSYGGTKVGLAYAWQVSGNPLPHEGHDVAVDLLVTDGAVWACRRA